VVASLLVPSGSSMAQTPIDPPAESPAGTVYELPVDKGRSDAAPGGKGGDGGAQSGPLGNGSLYRSENNFGTSAQVPGAPRSLRQDEPGEGDPLTADQTAAAGDPSGPDSGGTSESGAIALLALLGAAGVGVGFVSRRSWA
jgi:hypothetical protein